jgi:hypothetical protein
MLWRQLRACPRVAGLQRVHSQIQPL